MHTYIYLNILGTILLNTKEIVKEFSYLIHNCHLLVTIIENFVNLKTIKHV